MHVRRTFLYKTGVRTYESCAGSHRATHKTITRTVAHDTGRFVRAHKSCAALQVRIHRSRAVFNQAFVVISQTVTTALRTANLTFYVTITNDRIGLCIQYQQGLVNTSHLGICYIQVLNGTAV